MNAAKAFFHFVHLKSAQGNDENSSFFNQDEDYYDILLNLRFRNNLSVLGFLRNLNKLPKLNSKKSKKIAETEEFTGKSWTKHSRLEISAGIATFTRDLEQPGNIAKLRSFLG